MIFMDVAFDGDTMRWLHPSCAKDLLTAAECDSLEKASDFTNLQAEPWRVLWVQTADFFGLFSLAFGPFGIQFVSVPERSAIRSLWLPKWSYSARLTWKTCQIILIPRFFGKPRTDFWSNMQNHSRNLDLGWELTESIAKFMIDLTFKRWQCDRKLLWLEDWQESPSVSLSRMRTFPFIFTRSSLHLNEEVWICMFFPLLVPKGTLCDRRWMSCA